MRRWIRAAQLMSDTESMRRFVQFDNIPTNVQEIPLNVRPLRGRPFWIRPNTTDKEIVFSTFMHAWHLPPPDLMKRKDEIRLVWDLGANIGTTLAHFCVLFPQAHVVGIEMDSENARICRQNIASWRDRCEVIEAAVWSTDGRVSYVRKAGEEWAFRISDPAEGNSDAAIPARALSLNSLSRQCVAEEVDYLKMDIEGAEREVLRLNTAWASHVRFINVEVHDPYTVEECVKDLEGLGFTAQPDPKRLGLILGAR